MKRILTVDDSRAIRMIVAKQVREMGFEVIEAEDGEQGLIKVAEGGYDLVILDVTMPVLDGPGMLAKLRERGDKTPVLMLTSESKRSIIVTLMKLGIEDYILKPFKGEELKAKILKSLKMTEAEAAGGDAATAPEAPAVPGEAPRPTAPANGKPVAGMDVLLVDDMENVEKRLRTFLPTKVTLVSARTAQEAIALCRERSHRVILIDSDIPGVDSAALLQQLKLLQPQALFVFLALRSQTKAAEESRIAGFEGVLHKPFDSEEMDDFLQQHLDNQEMVVKDENVLTVAAFKGREHRMERYFSQVGKLIVTEVEGIAAACFGEIILDINGMPVHPERTARAVVGVKDVAKRAGLDLRLVATGEIVKALRQVSDTASIPTFGTVTDAREFEGA